MIALTPPQVKAICKLADNRTDYLVIETTEEAGTIRVTKWMGMNHSQVEINVEGK